MRNELMFCLRELHASWAIRPLDLRRTESHLDSLIHVLYDDTPLSEDASRAVGWFLRGDEEAARIREIVAAMDMFFEEFGTHLKEAHWLQDWRWLDLMAAISRFLAVHGEPPVYLDVEPIASDETLVRRE
jgi:hypothetical protein